MYTKNGDRLRECYKDNIRLLRDRTISFFRELAIAIPPERQDYQQIHSHAQAIFWLSSSCHAVPL